MFVFCFSAWAPCTERNYLTYSERHWQKDLDTFQKITPNLKWRSLKHSYFTWLISLEPGKWGIASSFCLFSLPFYIKRCNIRLRLRQNRTIIQKQGIYVHPFFGSVEFNLLYLIETYTCLQLIVCLYHTANIYIFLLAGW